MNDLVVGFNRMAERTEAWNRMRELLTSGRLIVSRIEFQRPVYPLSDAALAVAYAYEIGCCLAAQDAMVEFMEGVE